MVRRFDDVIEVRPAEGPDAGPHAFIWRGRLYVVRQVLRRWRERRAWWRDALEAPAAERPGPPACESSERSEPFSSADTPVSTALLAAAAEREIWRVEAAPGWSFASGIYDLAHEPALPRAASTTTTASTDLGDRWTLVRVAD